MSTDPSLREGGGVRFRFVGDLTGLVTSVETAQVLLRTFSANGRADLMALQAAMRGMSVNGLAGGLKGSLRATQSEMRLLGTTGVTSMRAARSEMDLLGGSGMRAGLQMARGLGLIAGGGLIYGSVRGIRDISQAYKQFDTDMRLMWTNLPNMSQDAFDKVSAQAEDFAAKNARTADEVAKALYDVTSVGFDPTQAMAKNGILQVASDTALGGNANLPDTTKAIITTLNTYGMSADKASMVADKLTSSVRDGDLTFSDLATTLSDLTPTASQTGVNLDNVAASVATMTKMGITAGESMTNLRMMLSELSKPNFKAGQFFVDATGGTTFVDYMKQGHDLVDVMDVLKKHMNETGLNAMQVFTRIQGAQAFTVLSSQTGEHMLAQSIYNSAHSAYMAKENADKIKNSTEHATQLAGAAWDKFKVQTGAALAPVIRDLAKLSAGAAKVFTNDTTRKTTEWGLAIAAAAYSTNKLISAYKVLTGMNLAERLGGLAVANKALATTQAAAAATGAAEATVLGGGAAAAGAPAATAASAALARQRAFSAPSLFTDAGLLAATSQSAYRDKYGLGLNQYGNGAAGFQRAAIAEQQARVDAMLVNGLAGGSLAYGLNNPAALTQAGRAGTEGLMYGLTGKTAEERAALKASRVSLGTRLKGIMPGATLTAEEAASAAAARQATMAGLGITTGKLMKTTGTLAAWALAIDVGYTAFKAATDKSTNSAIARGMQEVGLGSDNTVGGMVNYSHSALGQLSHIPGLNGLQSWGDSLSGYTGFKALGETDAKDSNGQTALERAIDQRKASARIRELEDKEKSVGLTKAENNEMFGLISKWGDIEQAGGDVTDEMKKQLDAMTTLEKALAQTKQTWLGTFNLFDQSPLETNRAKNIKKAQDDLTTSTKAVTSAEVALANFRASSGGASEASAKASLASAEASLNKLRGSGKASSSALTAASDRVNAAQARYNEVIAKGGTATLKANQLEQNLADARKKRAAAQDALTKAKAPQGLSIADLTKRADSQYDYEQRNAHDIQTLFKAGISKDALGQLWDVEKNNPGTLHRVATNINTKFGQEFVKTINKEYKTLEGPAADMVANSLNGIATQSVVKSESHRHAAYKSAGERDAAVYANAVRSRLKRENMFAELFGGNGGTGMLTAGSATGSSGATAPYSQSIPFTITGGVHVNGVQNANQFAKEMLAQSRRRALGRNG